MPCVSASHTRIVHECPPHRVILSAGFTQSGSSWLKLSTTTATWNDAKQACENMDVVSFTARLVVIKSQTKQNEVDNYLKQMNAGKNPILRLNITCGPNWHF